MQLNSALSLNYYDFDETKGLLTVSPILAFEKHALMEDYRILSLSASYSRPINWRPSKKAKLLPGVALLHQSNLYLFKPQEDGAQLTALRVVVLDYSLVYPETEDYIRVERMGTKTKDSDDAELKKDTYIYPKGRQEYMSWYMMLSAQCRNTIETKVMGIPLSVLFKRRISSGQGPVPEILSSAIKFLDQPDILQEEGIFRKSGGSKDMDYYIQRIDAGESVDYSDCVDIHNVTGILKKWLGLLPTPLLVPYEKFMEIDESIEKQEEVFNKAYEIIAQLPRYHHDTLIALLKFLNKVSTYSSQNLMTTKNLALVVGPNIIRPNELNLAGVGEQSGYASQLGNTPKVANIVTVLIEQCDKLQQKLELDKLLPPSSGISKLDLNKEIRERKIQMKRREMRESGVYRFSPQREGGESNNNNMPSLRQQQPATVLKSATGDIQLKRLPLNNSKEEERDNSDVSSKLENRFSPRRPADRERGKLLDDEKDNNSNTQEKKLKTKPSLNEIILAAMGDDDDTNSSNSLSSSKDNNKERLVSPRGRPTVEKIKIVKYTDSSEEKSDDLVEQIRRGQKEMYANPRKDSDGLRKKPSSSDLTRKEGDSMLKKNEVQSITSPRESRDARDAREAREARDYREAREAREVKELRESKEARDLIIRETRELREREAREARERESRESHSRELLSPRDLASPRGSDDEGGTSLGSGMSTPSKKIPSKLGSSSTSEIAMKKAIELLINKLESVEKNLEAQIEKNTQLEETVRNQGQSIQELQRFKNQYSNKLSTIFGAVQGSGNNSFNHLLNNNNNDSKLSDEASTFIEELYKEDPLFTNDNRPLSPRRITPRVGRSPNFPKK